MDYLSTEEFARAIKIKPASVRVRLCETGSYFGIRPDKLPNGRLLWPAEAPQQLLRQREAEERRRHGEPPASVDGKRGRR